MGLLAQIKNRGRQIKHLRGWKTDSKLVAFSVDDYGNVRTADAAARDVLRQKVPSFGGQMDEFDAVETRKDLEVLYEILSSHRDHNGNPCIFTAFCLSANADFEKIRTGREYAFETLAQTYARLESRDPQAYSGMRQIWQEGMDADVIRPQCHGREHICIPLIKRKLQQRAPDLEVNLQVDSMAGLTGLPELNNVGFTQAFGLTETDRIPEQAQVIENGLGLFKEFFGFASKTFVPPAAKFNRVHDELLLKLGVQGVDVPFLEYGNSFPLSRLPIVNFLGQGKSNQPTRIVRTLSFEPCSGVKSDPIGYALREVENAFACKRPVIISSHRVNFGGHIDAGNRDCGIKHLNDLIAGICKRWPEVQFISVEGLVELMQQSAAH